MPFDSKWYAELFDFCGWVTTTPDSPPLLRITFYHHWFFVRVFEREVMEEILKAVEEHSQKVEHIAIAKAGLFFLKNEQMYEGVDPIPLMINQKLAKQFKEYEEETESERTKLHSGGSLNQP